MEDVIQTLLNSAELKALCGDIAPFGQLKVGKGLTYEFYVSLNDGIKAKWHLSVTAISYSLAETIEILNKVNELLLTIGDSSFSNKVLSIKQNGGGIMNNIIDGKDMYFNNAAYDITTRR